ncbi:MAG: phenylalanine--tRNA ligase subunit alpha [Patescibacteria group bacterium]|nr:phenylalanine--tRNA ligase subunit alpha [Patescibacteria group bacterium]MBU1160705.1 phenylalanine--tRNA ligase subunit alpha [Patescibacteria group bacterium]MBU1420863.1 phenylalanine--tRNA ligase subunit alpha [Patescibacteria group bacterium]MBU1684518.1 phenylalanine--tRNA ligase subunit alpha [Patescibacteria group bacterium]MBU1778241.1 phenylalanine--tRNA ligase subunit alpha [Patescibacteria group bacterium]
MFVKNTQDKLNNLKQKILDQLQDAKEKKVLRDLEIKYLGRKGEFTKILRELKNLKIEEREKIGKLANQIKNELQKKFKELNSEASEFNSSASEFTDVTLSGEKIEKGHLHPITIVQNELENLFTSMGFVIEEGPELESDYYNFEALNLPKHHPARDMQDTFYVDTRKETKKNGQINTNDLVMRTHTSPVQIRAMQKYGAPLKCVVPGRVFRCEATDACHEHTFDQLEGLMIDKNISITNLIATMKELLKGIFKKDMEVRVRPGYFPFVKPGIELDIKCTICNGKKCPACKNSGWLELLPAGMVHPNVLKYGGIDPKKYSGFAFGLGLTRLAMMKYGINDIRLFNSGDLRFLKQF